MAEFDPELHTVPPDRGAMEDQPAWRRDFPIDSAQDSYVARREFTKFLGLTSLAFAAGQWWIAAQNRWRRRREAMPVVAVARLDEVPVGTARPFHYPTKADPAILLRPDANSLLAYSSLCTHLQCPVLPQMESGHLHCPCHAGYFDLKTGEPLAGPPRRPLPRISLKVDDDMIFAVGIEEAQP
jgi:Rieske Fe-S protein